MEAVLALLILVGAGLYAASRSSTARETSILQTVANVRGGVLVDGRMVLELDDLHVTVSVEDTLVHWHVALPPPGTTTFTVDPEGFASEVFGGQDVELDVLPAFDQMFVVKADDVPALRRLWRLEPCRLMTRHFSRGRVRGADLEIELEAELGGYTREDIEAGIDTLVALARADLYGVAVLRALPDAKPIAGGRVELSGPGEIRIGPHSDGARVVTRMWSSIVVAGKVTLPDALDRATLAFEEGETTITWPAIEDEPARLLAAVEFLRGFAAPPAQGVFR